jgi:hypothetical protein
VGIGSVEAPGAWLFKPVAAPDEPVAAPDEPVAAPDEQVAAPDEPALRFVATVAVGSVRTETAGGVDTEPDGEAVMRT